MVHGQDCIKFRKLVRCKKAVRWKWPQGHNIFLLAFNSRSDYFSLFIPDESILHLREDSGQEQRSLVSYAKSRISEQN
jgi:hypothetical protein